MKRVFSERVERARVTAMTNVRRHPRLETLAGDDFGFFELRTNAGAELGVMVSSGSDDVPWEHVSVSTRTRCPTWEEMSWVKSLFFEDEEAVIQFHPPRSQYVNDHPFCLHLWRPLVATVPLPPMIAVGLGAPVSP